MDEIAEVVMAVPADWKDHFEKEFSHPKLKIVVGGAERWQSVENGVNALTSNAEYVLVHDVARPFVSKEIILDVCETLISKGSCLVAKPAVDTIKIAKDGRVETTIDRNTVWMAQTFILRVVKTGTLINKRRHLAEHHKPVGKALWNVQLVFLFGGKNKALPLTERGAVLAEIHSHVEDFALDDTNKFALRILLLEVKTTEHALLTAGLVILHKIHLQASGIELRFVIRFHEVATGVTKHSRFHDHNAFNRSFDKIELSHYLFPYIFS